jgi:predicted peptidase
MSWETYAIDVQTYTTVQTISALLRVSINPHGRFDIVDFTTPSKKGRVRFFNALQEEIPQWVVEAVSMLRMTEERSVVPDLGYKVNDKLYYIIDRRDTE